MSKVKDDDSPYREQGPGVPWAQELLGEEMDASDVLRRLAEASGQVIGLTSSRAPLVHSLNPVKGRWMPRTFSVVGKAGECHAAKRSGCSTFKGGEFFAMDDSLRPGHGTIIRAAFNGATNLFPDFDAAIPTWMFYEWVAPEDRKAIEDLAALVGTEHETPEARAAKTQLRAISTTEKMTWPTWHRAIPFCFQIEFLETCRWEGVLWGWEIN